MSCTRTSPFVVLREATYEEWAAEQIEQGFEPKPSCDPSEASRSAGGVLAIRFA
jgi:hypothetical protein